MRLLVEVSKDFFGSEPQRIFREGIPYQRLRLGFGGGAGPEQI